MDPLNTQSNQANCHRLDKVLNLPPLDKVQNVNHEDLERGCNGVKVKDKKWNNWAEVELLVKGLRNKNTSTINGKITTSHHN